MIKNILKIGAINNIYSLIKLVFMIKISFINSFNSCLTLKNEFFGEDMWIFSCNLKLIFNLKTNCRFLKEQTKIME